MLSDYIYSYRSLRVNAQSVTLSICVRICICAYMNVLFARFLFKCCYQINFPSLLLFEKNIRDDPYDV